MAYIGLYGVYYSKATLTDGQVDGYSGSSTMGKAISATFTPQDSGENNGKEDDDNLKHHRHLCPPPGRDSGRYPYLPSRIPSPA